MDTIRPISETIPHEPDIVQLEFVPDPIILLPEHLDPEVEQLEVFPISFAP